MNDVSSRAYIGPLAKTANNSSPFVILFSYGQIYCLNPAISIIAVDFNEKCSKWYSFETRDNIGNELNIITSNGWYTQIIDKPNHFTNHSYSCIDLSFTSNPSIIEDSGIEKPLTINVHFLKLSSIYNCSINKLL